MSPSQNAPVSHLGTSISFTPHNDALQNVGSLTGYLLQESLKHPDGLTKNELEGFVIVLGEMADYLAMLSDETDKLQATMSRLSRRLWFAKKEARHG